jgi:DNA-binding XRE family transcriptional regulator
MTTRKPTPSRVRPVDEPGHMPFGHQGLLAIIERDRQASRDVKDARWSTPTVPRDTVPGLGQRLRALRVMRGLTQRALAERAGVPHNKIAAIELERSKGGITLRTAARLAIALDTTLDYLAGLTLDATPRR